MSSIKFFFSGPSEIKDFSDRLRHFQPFLCNRWTEFYDTWHKVWSQRALSMYVFFGPIWKPRWPPWSLIGWDIFDVYSATTERNYMKLAKKKKKYRSQRPLQALCLSCLSENLDGSPGLWIAVTFSTASCNRWKEFLKLGRMQDLNVIYEVRVLRPIKKQKRPLWPLIGWYIFDFLSATVDRKQDINVLFRVIFFRADRKKEHDHPDLWLTATQSTSLQLLNGIQQNFTLSKISISSTMFVFSLQQLNEIQRNFTGSKNSTSSTMFVLLGQSLSVCVSVQHEVFSARLRRLFVQVLGENPLYFYKFWNAKMSVRVCKFLSHDLCNALLTMHNII